METKIVLSQWASAAFIFDEHPHGGLWISWVLNVQENNVQFCHTVAENSRSHKLESQACEKMCNLVQYQL